MFNINLKSEKPIYEQIVENIKDLIFNNMLKDNDKLPSVREMATNLSVSPNTVSKAYSELENQGIIYSVRGRGTFINPKKDIQVDDSRIEELVEELKNICIELIHLGFSLEDIKREINGLERED